LLLQIALYFKDSIAGQSRKRRFSLKRCLFAGLQYLTASRAKDIAAFAKDIASRAKDIARFAKDTARRAKGIASCAKEMSRRAKQMLLYARGFDINAENPIRKEKKDA
jgi:methyl-accepting chemotaxis protein